jgi:arginine N-succinyltransferase
MSFIIRNVQLGDAKQLFDLASQFSLLNLPADKKILNEKIERSVNSFGGGLPREQSEYLFVVEDLEENQIVGSSLILAKHGTEDVPHSYFKVVKKDRYSEDIGVGFIHQVLQLKQDTNGPTEIGGLLVDRNYRKRPEKLGKQISLMRFIYIGLSRGEFEDRVLCELTPPLGEGGRSEFWEALGRRFTGLPYQEADLISQRNKEFIGDLFPQEDIYMALLDAKARLVLGRVGEETRPAQHLLESIGFKYLNEVDPFDGGPHYGCKMDDVKIIKTGKSATVVSTSEKAGFNSFALVGVKRDREFRGKLSPCDIQDNSIQLPPQTMNDVGLEVGEKVYYSPVKV